VRERREHQELRGSGIGSCALLRLTHDMTARLRAALPGAVHGPSWTTDAPYRETAEEVAKYRADGIVTVEMEASCLFTVASAVGVAAAAAFVVSDVLHGERVGAALRLGRHPGRFVDALRGGRGMPVRVMDPAIGWLS
jgi:purine-nucleoside phosphorylase